MAEGLQVMVHLRCVGCWAWSTLPVDVEDIMNASIYLIELTAASQNII
jgi:hypothetical protein